MSPYSNDALVLLTDFEVARLTGRARSTLQKDRLHGGGIPFVKLGRLARYRRADVEAYLAALPTLSSTSDGIANAQVIERNEARQR